MDSGTVIAGNTAQSVLYQSVNRGRMPPGLPLSQSEIDLIAKWIDQGALEVLSNNGNFPPTVQAGIDRTITLPTNSIVIDAVATDSDGSIIGILWT